jgi:hypothetical protein
MKQVSIKIVGRQEFFGNVYESKEAAKAGASMGHVPVLVKEMNGVPVNAWMNHCKHGFQEDSVRNAK